jgi:hypothetical protein
MYKKNIEEHKAKNCVHYLFRTDPVCIYNVLFCLLLYKLFIDHDNFLNLNHYTVIFM